MVLDHPRILAPTAALVLIAGLGCASPARLPGPEVVRSWPPAPRRARIELLGEIRGPSDLSMSSGIFSTLLAALVEPEDARLRRPYAVAVFGEAPGTGPGGPPEPGPARLAITDTAQGTVHLYDLERGRHRILTHTAPGMALEAPVGVAFDEQGRLYVCDSGRAILVRFSADGDVDRILSRGFSRPAGVAIDPARGVVYVSDAAEHVVRRFDLDGRVRGDIRVPFRFPTHLAVDREGRLLVSDAMNFRVALVSPTGELVAAIGKAGDASGDLHRPKGVATDSSGHVYVVDAAFDNVQIFDSAGRLLLAFGSGGSAAGELALPAGLAIDGRDLIYVADSYNGRVQVFRHVPGREP